MSKFEVVAHLSGPLPVIAIAEMLGVDPNDRESFRQWSDDLLAENDFPTDQELERMARAGQMLREYFSRAVTQRRDEPSDDLVGRLVEANVEGTLSETELLANCVLLLVAGNETTTNLITNLTLQLARHPDQLELLLDDPSLIPGAVEETLRFDGPVHWTLRLPTRPVAIGDCSIDAGEPILVLVAAANRDPAQFPDPDRYDVTRTGTRHIGFGHGLHYCLGAAIARLEARVAIESLLERAGRYTLADDPAELDYPRLNLRSPRRLVIVPEPRA